jgi:excisionase family DNA binding protein
MNLEAVISELIRAAVREELRPLQVALAEALAVVRDQRALSTEREDGLLTVDQVAAIAKVTEPTVRAWIRSGALKATRLAASGGEGRIYRVVRADLEDFVADGRRRHDGGVDVDANIKSEAVRIVELAARRRTT